MKQITTKSEQKDKLRLRSLTGPIAWGVVATLSSVSQQASAQEKDRKPVLEEIIVTAQKRAENLQDVPVAVTALTDQSLQAMGIRELSQIATATPSMVFTNVSAVSKIFLRGVGTKPVGNGLENSVASYMDERYVARPSAAMFDLMDVERVEVLKGPQGTLYGRNATGGAIRIISKEVSNDFEGSVQATAGNYNTWGLQGVVNVPVTDTFGFRIAAMTNERDGYQTNLSPVGVHDWNDKDQQVVRAKLRWNITDQVTSRLSLNYWTKDDMNGNGTVVSTVPSPTLGNIYLNPSVAAGGHPGDRNHVWTQIDKANKADEFSAELRFDVGFDGFDFQSVSTMSDLESESGFDVDGTERVDSDVIPGDGGVEKGKDYGQEFRLLSDNDSKWKWLIGGYGYHGKTTVDSPIDLRNPIPTGSVSRLSPGFQTVKTDSWAVFGELGYAFTDRLNLKVGSRYSADKKKVELEKSPDAVLTLPAVLNASLLPYSDKADWSKVTSSVTLEYRSDFGLMYAKYSEGYKGGGFNYPALENLTGRVLPTVDPETLKSYEVGLKADLLDQRLRINTSAYYYDFTDLQVLFAIQSGLIPSVFTVNAASATVKGADVELTWIPIERLSVNTSIAYTEGKYGNYPEAVTNYPNSTNTDWAGALFDASGYHMINSPKWTASVQLGYEFPLGEGSLPAVITYGWKSRYDDEFVVIPEHANLRQDDYGLLSARVSWLPSSSSKWMLSMWGNNLTDKAYFTNVVQNNTTYGAPRTYGVDVKYSF